MALCSFESQISKRGDASAKLRLQGFEIDVHAGVSMWEPRADFRTMMAVPGYFDAGASLFVN